MKTLLDANQFRKFRRDKLLDRKIYEENFNLAVMAFDVVGQSLEQPADVLKKIPLANFMIATQERAWKGIDHLTNAYSAGHELAVLRSFYPTMLEYWEEYAKYSQAYNESPEGNGCDVADLALLGNDFYRANRLVCLGILLGWGHLLHRLVPILDYNNPSTDGMLERLLSFYVNGREAPPDECTRHLPYFKTLKIFSSPKERQAELMAEYLEDWYHASRREPYYDSHKRDTSFLGYWSWEAAAITYLLDINDKSYANAKFYPKDLVDFAHSTQASYAPAGTPAIAPDELRAKAGEPCPKTGQWQSIDSASQKRGYKQGEPMDDLNSAYGITVWRYLEQ